MTTDTMIDESELDALGHGRIDHDHLAELVARCLKTDHVVIEHVCVTPVDYATSTIATAALDRVSGIARGADGAARGFSIFVKQLRSAGLWPFIDVIPEELKQQWVAEFPWRIEIDAFASPVARLMPDGLRMAELYEVVEVDTDRAAIWMEDVQTPTSREWTSDDFVRAARLLGELAGRRPAGSDTCLGELPGYRVPGLALRMYARDRILEQSFPAIRSDEAWAARGVGQAIYDDVRTRLRQATSHVDRMLDRLEELPQTYAHGDASPQNLLISAEQPDTFVIIDWGFNTPLAVGFDLGQLLLGLVNDDELSADELSSLEPKVVAAYTEGLHAVGFDATAGQVREGYALSVVIRSMFTALGLDEGPPDEAWTSEHKDNRVALTRYLLDLYEEYTRWTA